MDNAPPWLADEPELLKLLHAVLDRLDQQPGEHRQNRLHFSAEKSLPSLKKQDAAADQLWHFVQALQQQGVLAISHNKRNDYDAEWKNARLSFLPQTESTLRHWLKRLHEESSIQSWRNTVQLHAAAFPGGIEPLLKRRLTITGYSDAEIVTSLARIGSMRDPLTLRQLSCCIFHGDSKRLDDREDLIRALFPQMQIKPRPLVVAVHLPVECRGVLFIENQDNYAAAITGEYAAARNLALVYAAGFRGGAVRSREPGTTQLHYAGEVGDREMFEAWWFNRAATALAPLYFYGDLDFSGMAILASLRDRFGDVTAWQTGYAPLLQQLQQGNGHIPDISRKQQFDPGTTGCTYADTVLLPAIRSLGFMDQEMPLVTEQPHFWNAP